MNLSELLEMDAVLSSAVEKFKEDIVRELQAHASADGFMPIVGAPLCGVIYRRNLLKGNLSPDTYIGARQAQAVQHKLKSARTISEVIKTVQAMVEQEQARIGEQNTVKLNPNTVRILRAYLDDAGEPQKKEK